MSVDSSIIQTDTISQAQDGWSVPVAFQQFDPNAGTLTGVGLGLTGTVTGIAAVENLGSTATSAGIATLGTIALNAGTVVVDTAGPVASARVTLGAYDGTTDFAGASGTIATFVGSAPGTLTNNTGSLSDYVGTGTVGWTATSQASLLLESSGNILSVTRAEAGANVSLQYQATGDGSNPPSTGDEGSGATTWSYDPTTSFGSETTAPQVLRVNEVQTGGTSAVLVAQFDSSLGTLEAVVFSIIGTVDTGIALENLGTVAGNATITDNVGFTLLAGGSTVVQTSASTVSNVSLGAYDGTLDFAGTSGADLAGVNGSGTDGTNNLTTSLSNFIGTGSTTLQLATSSNALLTGPADLAYEQLTDAGAIVEVSYIYQPASSATATAPLAITGAAPGQVDIQTGIINPFLGVTLSDAISSETDTLVITESDRSHGSLGFSRSGLPMADSDYDAATGTYTITGSAADLSDSILPYLVFVPEAGTILPGQSIATNFTIELTTPGGSIVVDTATSVIQEAGVAVDTTSAAAAAQAVLNQETVNQTPVVTQNDVVPCFAAGTSIATPAGSVAVETLREGDIVLTATGQRRKITWIGRRTIDLRRHNAPEKVRPIRIARHAFGLNRPSRALHLSPDHAVYTDDVLIPVKHLVNGLTITQTNPRDVTYYHVELSSHDVILADNLPCETYLETGNRAAFDNGAVTDLHPDFEPQAWEAWQTQAYAPLQVFGDTLQRVQARLRSQASMLQEAKSA